jgi:hypothetical protein
LDEDTESILFLTNESDQPARIGFRATANSVTYYLTKLQLNPHETRAIDLRKLRDAQQPDSKKNKVPAATDGSVIWVRAANLPVSSDRSDAGGRRSRLGLGWRRLLRMVGGNERSQTGHLHSRRRTAGKCAPVKSTSPMTCP